jgi:hypothetical protein
LTAPATYYVDPASGSDANDCSTSATACASVVHVYDLVQSTIDMGGKTVTVRVLGNIVGKMHFNGPLVGQKNDGDFLILGNAANPAALTITDAAGSNMIFVENGARFGISGFTLSASGPAGFGIAVGGGTVVVSNLAFSAMGGAALDVASPQSRILCQGPLTFNAAGFQSGWVAEDNGWIAMPCAVTFNGASFSNAVEQADLGGMVDTTGASFSGSVSGASAHAYSGGVIQSGGVTPPGGGVSTASGGIYN